MEVSPDASPLLTTLLNESSSLLDQNCLQKNEDKCDILEKRWTKSCVQDTKFEQTFSILRTPKRIQVAILSSKIKTFRCVPTQNCSDSTNL